MRIKLPEVRFS